MLFDRPITSRHRLYRDRTVAFLASGIRDLMPVKI